MKYKLFFVLLLIINITYVVAHGEVEPKSTLDLTSISLQLIYISILIITIAVLVSVLLKNRLTEIYKHILFFIIVAMVLISSLFLIGSTIYLNLTSPTKGPVHWHADFEINICNKEIEISDPKGLLNRIGESDLHEHNDMRIHVEGTPKSFEEIELGSFFKAIGGEFTESKLNVPTNEGIISIKSVDLCNSKQAKLYLFVEGQEGKFRKWRLEEQMQEYIIAPFSDVPPGDRLLIIFTEKQPNEILQELEGDINK